MSGVLIPYQVEKYLADSPRWGNRYEVRMPYFVLGAIDQAQRKWAERLTVLRLANCFCRRHRVGPQVCWLDRRLIDETEFT